MSSRGTSLFSAGLKLIVSIAMSSFGLYVSILWLLRDMHKIPQLAFFTEGSFKEILINVMIPLILLGLSYAAGRDSLLEFFDVLKLRKKEKNRPY